MKQIIIILGLTLFILTSCNNKQAEIEKTEIATSIDRLDNQDNLFIIEEKISENFVRIISPKNSDFELPDSLAKTEPYKYGDFNADGKQDILVYLGACGTGGCMYGLFLNQHDIFYKLAFMGYLKNVEFKIENDGLWTIESSEELEPYNPSKIQITIFKFDKKTYQYELDTTYVYYDKETETMINEMKTTNR
jgi:hypothetical protein